MILAIANTGKEISSHFGHSEGCVIYYLNNHQITAKGFIENPLKKGIGLFNVHVGIHKNRGCSCRSFASHLIDNIQIDVIVTGHIGGSAYQLLSQQGIKVLSGIQGSIDQYLQDYVSKAG